MVWVSVVDGVIGKDVVGGGMCWEIEKFMSFFFWVDYVLRG